jgi:uridine kinase
MTQSIVIHGPQGCGKTLNGQRLRKHFGLQVIVDLDDYPGQRRLIATEGALVLTHDEAAAHRLTGFRVLSFKEAMRLAGFARHPSTVQADE